MSIRDEVFDFLGVAQIARLRKFSYEARLHELRAQAERLTKAISPTPGVSGSESNQEAVWAALADETARYVEELRMCGDVIHEVDEFIDRLPVPLVHREILRLRHCNGLRWKQVETMVRKSGYYYSEKYLWELHRKAMIIADREYEMLIHDKPEIPKLVEHFRKGEVKENEYD